MFRHTFGVIAALLVGTAPASATAPSPDKLPLKARIEAAQSKIHTLKTVLDGPKTDATPIEKAQWRNFNPWNNHHWQNFSPWNNHHWQNFSPWNNFRNYWNNFHHPSWHNFR
jgi:hypothetical protein